MNRSSTTKQPAKTPAAKPAARQAPAPAAASPVSMAGAIADPLNASPEQILSLQRQYGNRAVQRLQRQAIQRREAASSAEGGELDADLQSEIESARGGGHPLDRATGTLVGGALGADFSGVKVHTDARAERLNRSLNASAFTLGRDIFVGKNNYNPASRAGKQLLAHELTHVVQQGGVSSNRVQTKLQVGPARDRYEDEADRVAGAIMAASQPAAPAVRGAAPAVQRIFGSDKDKPRVISGPTNISVDHISTGSQQEARDQIHERRGYKEKFLEAGPNQGISRPKKEDWQAGDQAPSSDDVILKPGEDGKESAKHDIGSYRDLAAGYVKQAGTDSGVLDQSADMLSADFVDVQQGRSDFGKLDMALQAAKQAVESDAKNPAADKKIKKKNLQKYQELQKAHQSLLGALHEPDFERAESEAQQRAAQAQSASYASVQEKAVIEHLYDEVQKSKDTIDQRRKEAGKLSKKDPGTQQRQKEVDFAAKRAANAARGQVQQAKMSMDVVSIKRKQITVLRTHVQDKLGRFPGLMRRVAGKFSAGVVGALVNVLTLGLVSVKGNVSEKGFQGKGLEKKGYPYKVTFLNNVRNQMVQFRTAIKARPGGPSAIDYTSALLRAFNEMVVQNVFNVASKIALVSGILATVIAAASLGFAAPAAVPLAAISAVAAFVALIAATIKVGVDLARLTVDGLAALLNKDAKLSNVLGARAQQSGMETLFDAVQGATGATGPSTGSLIKGEGFLNQFDVGATKDFVTGQLTASNSLGTTLGATGANVGQTVGAPLITGQVAQGIKAATDDNYNLYAQHKDDRDKTGRSRLEASAMPSAPGNKPVDTATPHWMQSEMAKQNKLRQDTYKSRSALAVGQLTAVAAKATQIGSKLGNGKGDADKLVSLSKSGAEGEDQEMAQAQSGVMGEAAVTMGETVSGIRHGQSEIRKLGETL